MGRSRPPTSYQQPFRPFGAPEADWSTHKGVYKLHNDTPPPSAPRLDREPLAYGWEPALAFVKYSVSVFPRLSLVPASSVSIVALLIGIRSPVGLSSPPSLSQCPLITKSYNALCASSPSPPIRSHHRQLRPCAGTTSASAWSALPARPTRAGRAPGRTKRWDRGPRRG